MRFCGQTILVATLLIFAAQSRGNGTKQDTDKIQGTWKLVSLEVDGQQGPAAVVAKLKLVFNDNKLTFTPGEPGFTNYIYKLDPAAKPASFEMTHADGTNKGNTLKGIYLLEGDNLKICFGNKDFPTSAKPGGSMYVLKREKP